MPVEVVLDIYSGRTNPAWTLNRREITGLGQRLRNLHQETSSLPQPPALGYRGFHLRTSQEKMSSLIIVFNDIVQTESGNFLDPARNLERWLISLARDHVDAASFSYLNTFD